MRLALQALIGAVIADVMISGAEAVVAYPHPSAPAALFFKTAFVVYLPILALCAVSLVKFAGQRGLNLWFPLSLGVVRVFSLHDGAAGAPSWFLLAMGAVVIVGAARWAAKAHDRDPPFLFGLTVGVVLPILAARLAAASSVAGSLEWTRRASLGTLAGIALFLGLRTFVSRWPRVGPVFVLGPIVSLIVWSRNGGQPPAVAAAGPGRVNAPDIVVVVLDTVRAKSLRAYGHDRVTMPGLEAFAGTATRFSRAWTSGSWTLPAHASLFSGMRLASHRFDSGFDATGRVSADGFLAPRLRRAGYATGAVVANFGVFARETPLLTGFDEIEVEPLRPFAFRPWLFRMLALNPGAFLLDAARERFPGPSVRAPSIVERAKAFWIRNEARPRLLFVNVMEAHLPWIPDSEDLGRFGSKGLDTESEQLDVLGRPLRGGGVSEGEASTLRDRYEESLFTLDRSLSALLSTIQANPKRNLVIVVTSDHGESLGEHGRFGHRNSLDEETARIPLFIRGPGLERGAVVDSLVEIEDVFGYLVESAGLSPPSGLDTLPFGQRRTVVIAHRPGPQSNMPAGLPVGDLIALVDWPFKFIEGPSTAASLFDLAVDPGELNNLADSDPARVGRMRERAREAGGQPSSKTPGTDAREAERLRALGYVR